MPPHPDAPRSVTTSIRIDPRALDVLEWHARYTGYPLRSRIRELLQQEAADISAKYSLPDELPESALGKYKSAHWRLP